MSWEIWFFKAEIGAKMAKNRQKIKKFNKKLSFWDRESLIPKKITEKFDFACRNWQKKVGNKFQDIDKIGAKEQAKDWKKISISAKKSLITKGFTKKLILKPKLGQKWQNNMQRICNSTYCPAEGSPLSLAGCSSTRMLVSGAFWILKKQETP